jgi:hypothetical protein
MNYDFSIHKYLFIINNKKKQSFVKINFIRKYYYQQRAYRNIDYLLKLINIDIFFSLSSTDTLYSKYRFVLMFSFHDMVISFPYVLENGMVDRQSSKLLICE